MTTRKRCTKELHHDPFHDQRVCVYGKLRHPQHQGSPTTPRITHNAKGHPQRQGSLTTPRVTHNAKGHPQRQGSPTTPRVTHNAKGHPQRQGSPTMPRVTHNAKDRLNVPAVDRGCSDPRNILGVITEVSDNEQYTIGCPSGLLRAKCSRNQFDLCPEKLLSLEDINTRKNSGQGLKKCNCGGRNECETNRCSCRKNNNCV